MSKLISGPDPQAVEEPFDESLARPLPVLAPHLGLDDEGAAAVIEMQARARDDLLAPVELLRVVPTREPARPILPPHIEPHLDLLRAAVRVVAELDQPL